MRIIVDCDPGNTVPASDVDDGLALGLALTAPGVTLEAVTVVAGNTPREVGVAVARDLLSRAGAGDVPVFPGAAVPLAEDPGPWRADLDGRRDTERARKLWQGVTTTPGVPSTPSGSPGRSGRSGTSAASPDVPGTSPDVPAAPGAFGFPATTSATGGASLATAALGATAAALPDTDAAPVAAAEIVRRVAAAPGEIHLVAVGPLTNVAHALQLRPELAQELASLTIMGGAFAVPGLLQELNFGYDPEAAHAVLTSGAPITLVPYDVTRLTSLTLADLDRLAGHGPLADYLAETTRPWVRWVAEARRLPGCYLHDPLAVAVLLEPGLATRHRARVDVELRGTLTRARPIAWDATGQVMRATGLSLPEIEPIEVLDGVDNDRLVAYLIDTIVRAGR
ncbi:nucleoside hydrolase [Nonomuraea sp. NPDC050404]|uniref:nucleoside hydrolase n=1 Tax=Nonomuraea sp. NPDC050404 TaxID=3155783 RepID=UPI003400E832